MEAAPKTFGTHAYGPRKAITIVKQVLPKPLNGGQKGALGDLVPSRSYGRTRPSAFAKKSAHENDILSTTNRKSSPGNAFVSSTDAGNTIQPAGKMRISNVESKHSGRLNEAKRRAKEMRDRIYNGEGGGSDDSCSAAKDLKLPAPFERVESSCDLRTVLEEMDISSDDSSSDDSSSDDSALEDSSSENTFVSSTGSSLIIQPAGVVKTSNLESIQSSRLNEARARVKYVRNRIDNGEGCESKAPLKMKDLSSSNDPCSAAKEFNDAAPLKMLHSSSALRTTLDEMEISSDDSSSRNSSSDDSSSDEIEVLTLPEKVDTDVHESKDDVDILRRMTQKPLGHTKKLAVHILPSRIHGKENLSFFAERNENPTKTEEKNRRNALPSENSGSTCGSISSGVASLNTHHLKAVKKQAMGMVETVQAIPDSSYVSNKKATSPENDTSGSQIRVPECAQPKLLGEHQKHVSGEFVPLRKYNRSRASDLAKKYKNQSTTSPTEDIESLSASSPSEHSSQSNGKVRISNVNPMHRCQLNEVKEQAMRMRDRIKAEACKKRSQRKTTEAPKVSDGKEGAQSPKISNREGGKIRKTDSGASKTPGLCRVANQKTQVDPRNEVKPSKFSSNQSVKARRSTPLSIPVKKVFRKSSLVSDEKINAIPSNMSGCIRKKKNTPYVESLIVEPSGSQIKIEEPSTTGLYVRNEQIRKTLCDSQTNTSTADCTESATIPSKKRQMANDTAENRIPGSDQQKVITSKISGGVGESNRVDQSLKTKIFQRGSHQRTIQESSTDGKQKFENTPQISKKPVGVSKSEKRKKTTQDEEFAHLVPSNISQIDTSQADKNPSESSVSHDYSRKRLKIDNQTKFVYSQTPLRSKRQQVHPHTISEASWVMKLIELGVLEPLGESSPQFTRYCAEAKT